MKTSVKNCTALSLLLLLYGISYAQNQNVQNILNEVKIDSMTFFVAQLTGEEPVIIGGNPDMIISRHRDHPGNEKAFQFIKEKFQTYGLQLDSLQFSSTGKNLFGIKEGMLYPDEKFIIGAHYDNVSGVPGADDNASGVAMMIDLASKLRIANKNNNYLFVAFSGEEIGLLGSNYYTKNAIIELSNINYMINMDMVGRLNEDTTLAVYGLGTSPIFKQTIGANNTKFKIIQKESGVGPSDHTSFYLNDIPVLHFFTGQHEDYHKPSDDYDKINFEGMNMISNYIFDIISDLNDNGKLSFTKTINESEEVPRFKVSLGVIPDYLFDGEGMRIDGVTENRPAQIAGLLKGDIVIKIGEYEIKNMMGYMKALSKFEKGNTTTVSINRNGDKLIKKITF